MSKLLAGSLKMLVSRLRMRRTRIAALERARRVIGSSDLFNAEWYLQNYPDVAKAGKDPLDHFILHAGSEGRNPGPRFDARWYFQRHPDVARLGVNPLLHYLEHGRGEGRSIKALVAGVADESDGKSGGGQAPAPPSVPPYLSDYDTAWKAHPIDWLTLEEPHKRAAASTIGVSSDPRELLSNLTEGAVRARIALFLEFGQGTDATAELQHIAHSGLGLDRIADGWFAHGRQLLLRMDNAVVGACQLVGFQRGNDGALHRIVAGPSVAAPGLVRLKLQNPLGPVLLIWLALDGTPVDAALVLFPSLYRGGIHHAEALAVSSLRGETASIADYMIELAHELFGRDPLLLGQITVALRGANGSEAIFQPAIVHGLAGLFGIEMAAESDIDRAYSPAARLRSTVPLAAIAERRLSAAELLLPPDCLPSLAALCSLATSERVGAAALAIVPQGHAERAVLVCLPQAYAATVEMAHPALPHAIHVWRGPSVPSPQLLAQAGLPSAIRTMDSTVWQVDPLVPLSPDVTVPKAARGALPPPSVRVILSHSGSPEELTLSLAAIAAQIGVELIDIRLVTDQPDLPSQNEGDVPFQICTLAELACKDIDTGDLARFVILTDTAVFVHDPRTFTVLANLCSAAGIGAATCAVVTSRREEEAEMYATVSSTADCTVSPPVPADHMIVGLVPGATFDVFAGDSRILAFRSEMWNSLLADKELSAEPGELAFALAGKCKDHGLTTVATTLIRVATSRAEEPLLEKSTVISDLYAKAAADGAATHLLRLMP